MASVIPRSVGLLFLEIIICFLFAHFKDQYLHINCFRCNDCSTTLENSSYYEEGDHIICSECFVKKHSLKCQKCKNYIGNEKIIRNSTKGFKTGKH
ncbi:hypothetical protein HZS_2934 [Henneguya salminicola]|nr:hypothetical protein HZS_2934 [Henneguya salminicola]